VPYQCEPFLNKEAEKRNVKVYFKENIDELPDKRWLHPLVPGASDQKDYFPHYPFPKGVSVTKGYTCYTIDEIRNAKNLLKEQGVNKVIIKSVLGSMGRGIYLVNKDEHFEDILTTIDFETRINPTSLYPNGFIIEEAIDMDIDENGVTYSPMVHFLGDKMCPGVYYQRLVHNVYSGSKSYPELPESVVRKIMKESHLFQEAMQLEGPWGLDFLVDRHKNIYMIDPNIGRFCGSHYARIFMNMYAPGKHFYCYKCGVYNGTLTDFQKKLGDNKLAFDFESKKGVIFNKPYNNKFSYILIVEDTPEEVELMLKKLKEVMMI